MPRQRTDSVQTAIRMPSELYARLQAAAGEHGVSEEIRRRLEASFAGSLPPPPADTKTAELVGAIVGVAETLERDFGAWHTDPGAFEVLRQAMDKLLRFYRPPGEPALTAKRFVGIFYETANPDIDEVARMQAKMELEGILAARSA